MSGTRLQASGFRLQVAGVAALAALAACDTTVRTNTPDFEEFVPDAGEAAAQDAGPTAASDAGPDLDAGPVSVVEVHTVLPGSGPVSGGTQVILTGKGFAKDLGDPSGNEVRSKTIIRFGGNAALDFRVVDDDTIEVKSPTGLPGAADVTVQNPNGTGTCAGCFRFFVPVVLRSVTPNRGPSTGGTEVVLAGSGFEPGVQVLFGAQSAAAVHVASASRIEARAPAAAGAGAVDVAVAGRGGLWSLRRAFIYFDPVRVDRVEPPVGPLAGGNTIVLRGAGFTVNSTVTVGGLACGGALLRSDGSLSCAAPPSASTGARDVTVATPGAGSATLAGGYAYADPAFRGFALYAITPARGPAVGGNTVQLAGQGFGAGNFAVRIGAATATVLQVVSDWQAAVRLPAAAPGLVDVQARSDLGGGKLAGAYRYDEAVVISAVTPGSAPASGVPEVTVTLDGSGFHGALDTVAVGGIPAVVQTDSPTQITFTAPAGAEGPVEIVVQAPAPDGFLREGRAPFRFTAPLSIVQIDPATAAMSGGQSATIFGSGFDQATRATFGATQVEITSAMAPNRFTVKVPPGEVGPVDVIVDNGAATDVLVQGFSYYDPTSPYGGLSGGPMNGILNVTVLDIDSGAPLAGARVFVGVTNPLAQSTDERGMTTFQDPSLVKSVSVTVSKTNYQSATVEGVQSRNLTVYIKFNSGPCEDGVDNDGDGKIDAGDPECALCMSESKHPCCDSLDNDGDGLVDKADPECNIHGRPPDENPPPPGPPPAFISGRVYGFKKDPNRVLEPYERWVARVYHAPLTENLAPPYTYDLVEPIDLSIPPQKQYGYLGYVTVSRDGGAYVVPGFFGDQAMYAMYGVESTDSLEFEPYLMGIRQGVDGKPGETAEGQDIVLSMHLDQTVPITVEQPLSYFPGPVYYFVFPFLDLGGEGRIPVAGVGSPQMAYPAALTTQSKYDLTHMPQVPGENLLFFVWGWSGKTVQGQMALPISFQWRRQPGDLSQGLSVGPLLGLATAQEPLNGGTFTGRIAWTDTSGGMAPDLARVELEEQLMMDWKPWLLAVVPGTQSSVTMPIEAVAGYFPPGTLMRWTLITAREPRFDYDQFTYVDVSGQRWTSWAVEQNYTITP